MVDRIKPLKIEGTGSGGSQNDDFPTSLNKNEDYVDCRGLCLQNDTSDNETILIDRNASDDLNLAGRWVMSSGGILYPVVDETGLGQNANRLGDIYVGSTKKIDYETRLDLLGPIVRFAKSGQAYPLDIGYAVSGALEFTRGISGAMLFMTGANYPQLVLGDPTTDVGAAYIDGENNRPLYLNLLHTGGVYIGEGGLHPENSITYIGESAGPWARAYLDNAFFSLLTSDPGTPTEGQLWYNTTDKALRGYIDSVVREFITTKSNRNLDMADNHIVDVGQLEIGNTDSALYYMRVSLNAGGTPVFGRGIAGAFIFGEDANYPQILLGGDSSTGYALIDADNNRDLLFNSLHTGKIYIGEGGLFPTDADTPFGDASEPWGDAHVASVNVGDEPLNAGIGVYDAAGGQTVAGTAVTVNLDTVMKNMASTIYSLATDQITIAVAGTYKIDAQVSLMVTTGTSRSQAECWLESNPGGGMAEITGTRGQMYLRQLNFGATAAISIVRDFAAGEVVQLRAIRTQGTDTIQTDAAGSRMTITRLA